MDLNFFSGIRCAPFLYGCTLLGIGAPVGAVDVVPFGGLRFGGDVSSTTYYPGTGSGSGGAPASTSQSFTINSSASYGLVIDFPLPADFAVQAFEVYASRQQTNIDGANLLSPPIADLTVGVLQVGVVAVVPTAEPRLDWLVTATGGATRFETSAGSETRPSLGIGAAVRWMANDHIGVRADLRALVDFTGNGGSILACNGGCTYNYSGTVVVQGEASVGIVLRF